MLNNIFQKAISSAVTHRAVKVRHVILLALLTNYDFKNAQEPPRLKTNALLNLTLLKSLGLIFYKIDDFVDASNPRTIINFCEESQTLNEFKINAGKKLVTPESLKTIKKLDQKNIMPLKTSVLFTNLLVDIVNKLSIEREKINKAISLSTRERVVEHNHDLSKAIIIFFCACFFKSEKLNDFTKNNNELTIENLEKLFPNLSELSVQLQMVDDYMDIVIDIIHETEQGLCTTNTALGFAFSNISSEQNLTECKNQTQNFIAKVASQRDMCKEEDLPGFMQEPIGTLKEKLFTSFENNNAINKVLLSALFAGLEKRGFETNTSRYEQLIYQDNQMPLPKSQAVSL